MKKRVHVISHSHWDREWYMPLEEHKMRLLDLIDDNITLFESDPEFRSFHLDGQTIVLDDYLEICPQNKEKIEKYAKEGRFRVGPFYILQDEFLTSGEANVRNIQTGIREAKAYGNLTKVGYFPDAFGNAGQMPQLLKQAGMDAVAFGRGVKPIGFNNEVLDKDQEAGGKYESAYSEMMWEAPDGSTLLGILFANWYHNGVEIPVEEKAAKKYWDERIAKAEMFASTGELLFMNGCDHQPVQTNLSQALETARKLYPDIEFIHSNFEDYVRTVKEEVEHKLSVVKGELTSQETDGWYTLVNTCSSHVYLKQRNRKNEVALEQVAEPLCTWAALEGSKYPQDQLQYAWKILMQNHPHDSICGCSVDPVNKEMEIRFDRSTQAASYLAENAASYLAAQVNTDDFQKEDLPFVLFNTTGWERSESVSVVLDIVKDRHRWIDEGYRAAKALNLPSYVVVDADGNEVEALVEDAGVKFGYDLPRQNFRQPYMARQVKVTMFAEHLPACGYKTYALRVQDHKKSSKDSLVTGNHQMENAFLAVAIAPNGTLTVTDKVIQRTYEGLCYFEDTMDAGNEYIYFCPPQNPAITTRESEAKIRLTEDTSFFATYEICHELLVPVSADEQLLEDQKSVLEFKKRRCHRSSQMTTMQLYTYVTLQKDSRSLKIRTEFDNHVKDHRLRVVVPTGLKTEEHYAETVFEAVRRPNAHSKVWENPCKCEHQQSYVGMNDALGGILVGNIGLYEYEVLPQENNAMAVTLVRCVGEMGDWGVFFTELSQQQRHISSEYELTFYSGDLVETGAFRWAHQFQVPVQAMQTDIHVGKLPLQKSYLDWTGEAIALTNCKKKDGDADRMIRFVNYGAKDRILTIQKDESFETLYRSNIIEEELETLQPGANGRYDITVRGYEILTLGMKA